MATKRTKRPLWSLAEAVELVQVLEPAVRALNYHTTLGGSVLHKGASNKDLDLFFTPLNGSPTNASAISTLLDGMLDDVGTPLRTNDPRYAGEDPELCWYQDMLKYAHNGKRIDVFIQ